MTSDNVKREIADLLPRLRRFATALMGNTVDGDDLVQTSCTKAIEHLDQFKAGTKLDSWMFKIVHNTFLDSRRRMETRFTVPDLDAIHRQTDHGRAQSQAEDMMLLTKVRAAVASLPEDQRAVLTIVAIDGCSYKEAADILDIPIGTVMSRLARARAQLKPLAKDAFS